MLTRRAVLMIAGAMTAAAWLPSSVMAQQASPTAFVQQTGDQLLGAMRGASNLQARQQVMREIVERTVDVDGIARFCLGRFWRTATPQQQQEYVQLFHRTLLDSIIKRLGDYTDVSFKLGRATPQDDGTIVSSTITPANHAPLQVGWVVGNVGGQMKLVDVIGEGTSLRLTERSDYTSFLERNGGNVQALIDALKRQAAQQGS